MRIQESEVGSEAKEGREDHLLKKTICITNVFEQFGAKPRESNHQKQFSQYYGGSIGSQEGRT